MPEHTEDRVELVNRVTFPTSCFAIARKHQEWIAAEATRKGISKSKFVREVFNLAMKRSKEAA